MSGMNDDRRPQSGRSIREIISDATDRELKDFATGNLTPDELVAMAAAEERRRKRRMRRISGIAALFVIVLACGAFFVFNTFTTDVDADKNPKEEIVTEDGVIIEDGGWGSSSEDTWEINNWDEVKSAKATFAELGIPEYIPEGYIFNNLSIEEMENAITAKYIFCDMQKNELVIQQNIHNEGLGAIDIYESDRKLESKSGEIYICENHKNNTAIIKADNDCIVEIFSILNDDDIVKVIEGIKY